jgi:hypothetical protein
MMTERAALCIFMPPHSALSSVVLKAQQVCQIQLDDLGIFQMRFQ